MRQPLRRKGRRWPLVLAFALAVLLSQTLGLLHEVVHPHVPTGEQAHSAQKHLREALDGVGQPRHEAAGTGFLALLFSGHQSDSDCQAYDQLCHFDALVDFAAPVLPLVLQAVVLLFLAGQATTRWHALFQARGPPSPR